MAPGAGCAESCGICLAAVIASDCCGQGLCRVWWRLYFYGHTLALGSGRHSSNCLGFGWLRRCFGGHGNHHVCTAHHITNAGTATPTTLRLRLHSVGAHAANVIGPGRLYFGGLSARALASGFAAKPPVLVMAKAGKVAVGLGAKFIGGMVIHGVLQLWGRPV